MSRSIKKDLWVEDRYIPAYLDPPLDFWYADSYLNEIEPIDDVRNYCERCDGFHDPDECECG